MILFNVPRNKYNGNLVQVWVVVYNGTGNYEDEASDIAVSKNGKIFVTGYSSNNNGNSDFTTMKYIADGTLHWAHIYDGIGEGNDMAYSLSSDNNDNLYVTGKTKGCGTKDDFITIKYSAGGEIKWVQRYDNRDSDDDAAFAVKVNNDDKVFVSGMSYNGETFHVTVVKYTPNITNKEKEVQDIRTALELLAIGLKDISKNTQVKQIVNDVVDRCPGDYYFIFLSRLFEEGQILGIDVKAAMNQTIAVEKGFNPGKDIVGRILKALEKTGGIPHIAIPHFKRFSQNELAHDPKLSYEYLNENYPLPCVNCPQGIIKLPETKLDPTWIVVTKEAPNYYLNGDPMVFLEQTSPGCYLFDTYCSTCRTTNPTTGSVPQILGGQLLDYEIGINFDYDGCVDYDQVKLSKIPGFIYWDRDCIFAGASRTIKKTNHPIIKRMNTPTTCGATIGVTRGDVLKLCLNTEFNSSDEFLRTFALSMGGVFKVEKPGIGLLPVYFSFPYARQMWYFAGPDMSVNYSSTFTGNTCLNGKSQITENFSLNRCEFCDVEGAVFGSGTDYLASTDRESLLNYWRSNVITVGIGNGALAPIGSSPYQNIVEFPSSAAPPGCIPSGTLLGSLLLDADGNFEIEDITNISFNPSTPVTIFVRANFKDGSSVNECKTLPLSHTAFDKYFIYAQIRGNIKDYNAGIINYQVDVYQ